ncbi:hydrolase activity protein [[Candida] boidinii]|nr:hydrolase activity protein [[Candida] boidinii]
MMGKRYSVYILICSIFVLVASTVISVYLNDMAGNLTFTSNKVVIPHYEYPLEKSLNTEKVTSAYNDVNIYELEDMITNLTSFNDRRYNSLHGLEAATYIYDILVAYAAESPGLFHASIIHHKGWLQPSLVFTVNGISPDHIVVVGSHLDSMSYLPSFLTSAPGADDNASGVATLLESIRLLVPIFKEKIPENTIQFHFYSAEETGSLGSLEIYRYFNDQHKNKYNKKIVAMLQQDMTGYTKGSTDLGLEEHFGIVKSYASSNLNLFIKMLIQNYCDIPYRDTECSMICSDHAAATINGFPAAYVLESIVKASNPYTHTNKDTIEKLNFNHIKEHVKLVIAFSYELSYFKSSWGSFDGERVSFNISDYFILFVYHTNLLYISLFSFIIIGIFGYITFEKYFIFAAHTLYKKIRNS